jgi:acetolactate synthase-1/2/3 large subunit
VLKQEHDLPVKIAIINNGFLGMVRQWQQFFYDKRYVGTPICLARLCEAGRCLRHSGLTVTQPDEVITAIEQANATPGPFLIDFQVKEEVNVYPMVPPGAAVDQLIRRPQAVGTAACSQG